MTRMRSEGNSACEEPPSCQLKKRIVNLLLLVASGDNYCTLGCSKYLAEKKQFCHLDRTEQLNFG